MPITTQSEDLPVHILIAEDSTTQAEQLRHMLAHRGFSVSVARNGREALAMALTIKPTLIISDVIMPEMDGYELCYQIKADPALRSIPVILVTTMSDPMGVIMGLECGADNFILKPYDERYLLGRIQYVLFNREFHSFPETSIGLEVFFNNKRHYITAERLQILNLLLSTYDAAVQQNMDLKEHQKLLETQSVALQTINGFLDSVIENIPGMVFVKDASTLQHIRLNRAGETLLGHSREEVIGKNAHELFPIAQADLFHERDEKALARGEIIDVEEIISTSKGERLLHTKVVPIVDECGYPTHLLGISEDVTEQKAMEKEIRRLNAMLEERADKLQAINEEQQQKLNYLALFDSLTGLPNRQLLLERVAQSFHSSDEANTCLAIAVMSIRGMDLINHSFGKEVGDELLKSVAERLSNDRKIQVGRIAGNQFGILLPGLNDNDGQLSSFLNRSVLGPLKQPFSIGLHELNISICCGVALLAVDGADAEKLIANAEVALKKAKYSGEELLFYTPELNRRMTERLMLERQLRRAIEKKEFVLHYQPKVSTKDGRVTGLEALIRWNNPERGMVVPPSGFIPLLEETGMILEVGQWIINQARKDYRAWRNKGLAAVPIAVNVSPIQLRGPEFFHSLMHQGTAPDNEEAVPIELEITESMLMEDVENIMPKLHALKEAGYTIAIDDFGIGYSSFSHLSKLPLDTLKIDPSFIKELNANEGQSKIASMIIMLAHALGLKVIAEGVETETQKAKLESMDCDELQGYLLGKPLPADEIQSLLELPQSVSVAL